MKVIIWPIILFVAALLVAHFFFGINVGRLLEGFGDFVADILDGPG